MMIGSARYSGGIEKGYCTIRWTVGVRDVSCAARLDISMTGLGLRFPPASREICFRAGARLSRCDECFSSRAGSVCESDVVSIIPIVLSVVFGKVMNGVPFR